MIRTIKTGENCFFPSNKNKYKYEQNSTSSVVIRNEEGTVLTATSDMITQEYGGQIVVQHNDDKYIIDDGYQPVLIKAGYIIFKEYDIEDNQIMDRNGGLQLQEQLKLEIYNAIDYYMEYEGAHLTTDDVTLEIYTNEYKYIVIIDTIQSIIQKNQNRKDNGLPFYPFIKNMDRYATFYVSIFAEKIDMDEVEPKTKFKFVNNFITELMKTIGNEYHWTNVPVRKRLLYWPNL